MCLMMSINMLLNICLPTLCLISFCSNWREIVHVYPPKTQRTIHGTLSVCDFRLYFISSKLTSSTP
ncbi:hypothetical protein [Heliothis virescens ascovirus 3e]|uniref:Uncharacterized protein n=2 Tax=Ascovirus hvav3a TaxID=3444724 RepID=A4KX65_HVAVE|nr:hypothetical protein HVAV3e_gp009 [Heliothis virescens ascovirus 3e]YP_009701665.1 hypothetical protein F8204_gp009 [Heliothis virescens ascovirus 3g]ABO37195.1 hypothetical protein [Heliothis virescens ascovirus 3e]AFV50261.1 hypothetical protein [Heliothis virescens ascovirus 3g]